MAGKTGPRAKGQGPGGTAKRIRMPGSRVAPGPRPSAHLSRDQYLDLYYWMRLTRSLEKCRPFLIARDWRPALTLTDDANLRAKLAPAAQQLDLFA